MQVTTFDTPDGVQPETFTLRVPTWDIEDTTGYVPLTTFWGDFSIADAFGPEAVIDTFRGVFSEWRDNVKYVTELSLVLNHKIWQHYDGGRHIMATTYDRLWRLCDGWCRDNLTGDDANYYYRITN